MSDPTTLALVEGSSLHRWRAARPARDVYKGDTYLAARRYVEACGLSWRLLTPRHGLLSPDVLTGYSERTDPLALFGSSELVAWSRSVADDLLAAQWVRESFGLPRWRRVLLFATIRAYHTPLADMLRAGGLDVIVAASPEELP